MAHTIEQLQTMYDDVRAQDAGRRGLHRVIATALVTVEELEAKLESIKGTVADCFDGADTDDVEEVIRAVSNLFSAAYLRIAETEARTAKILKAIKAAGYALNEDDPDDVKMGMYL